MQTLPRGPARLTQQWPQSPEVAGRPLRLRTLPEGRVRATPGDAESGTAARARRAALWEAASSLPGPTCSLGLPVRRASLRARLSFRGPRRRGRREEEATTRMQKTRVSPVPLSDQRHCQGGAVHRGLRLAGQIFLL